MGIGRKRERERDVAKKKTQPNRLESSVLVLEQHLTDGGVRIQQFFGNLRPMTNRVFYFGGIVEIIYNMFLPDLFSTLEL